MKADFINSEFALMMISVYILISHLAKALAKTPAA